MLCDLLTGAVAATWSDALSEGGAKKVLSDHIARQSGRSSLREFSPTPTREKLNIFSLRLRAATA
jgi:hypothetical protein